MKTSNTFKPGYAFLIGFSILSACSNLKENSYKGIPYTDSIYTMGMQAIPGRLECEYYDLGGEGVAYHDSDSINSGSGALNPINGTYLHAFRANEAVDISYTKCGRDLQIDDTEFNFVQPEANKLYLGWTNPGEWVKYTVDVKTSGKYQLGLMYTSNQDGQISISVDETDATGPITIPNTYVEADTVDWRQWHHWNYLDDMATIELSKGIHVLTLKTVAIGQMNYEHIDFTLLEQ